MLKNPNHSLPNGNSNRSQNVSNLNKAINLLETTFSKVSLNKQQTKTFQQAIELLQNVESNLEQNTPHTNGFAHKHRFHFNQMSENVINLVLQRVSMQKLLYLRLICLRWKVLIESLFRQKHSLKLLRIEGLLEYCEDLAQIEPDHFLRMKLKPVGQDDDLFFNNKFRLQHCAVISELFLNISYLVVNVDHIYPALPKLLTMFPQLTGLSLYGNVISPKCNKLFHAIRSLTSLRYLDLLCYNLHNIPIETIKSFTELEHISVIGIGANFDHNLALLESIGQKCAHLRIVVPVWMEKYLHQSLLKDPHMLNNITHLTVEFLFVPEMFPIILHFVNLKYLSISLYKNQPHPLTLSQALHEITKLQDLNELRISLAFIDLPDSINIYPLTSVKRLKLSCTSQIMNFDPIQWSETFASLFPKLEGLILNGNMEVAIGDQLKYLKSLFRKLQSYAHEHNVLDYMGRHKQWHLDRVKEKEELALWNTGSILD